MALNETGIDAFGAFQLFQYSIAESGSESDNLHTTSNDLIVYFNRSETRTGNLSLTKTGNDASGTLGYNDLGGGVTRVRFTLKAFSDRRSKTLTFGVRSAPTGSARIVALP